jgi:NAD(P)-dependent dehydrogenase (short-subunit alcohol dehydrogenase family)
MRLEGKVALITGGVSGIGLASAILFAREGASIMIADICTDKSDEALKKISASGAKSTFVVCDIRSAVDCHNAVQTVLHNYHRLDILFNNAGIVPFGSVENTDETTWDNTMATNIKGIFLMSREAIPIMRQQGGGCIINTASDAGLVGAKEMAAYCASKGAVVMLTKNMALDYAKEGIRVNAICPGYTYVERWAERSKIGGPNVEEYVAMAANDLPLGRVGKPEEIAHAALFLASDESSFITGSALSVDGGYTAQ